MQNLVEIKPHVGVGGQSVMFFTFCFFVNHAEPLNGAGDAVALIKRK